MSFPRVGEPTKAYLDRGSDFQGGLDSNYYSDNLRPITGYITAHDNNLCGVLHLFSSLVGLHCGDV